MFKGAQDYKNFTKLCISDEPFRIDGGAGLTFSIFSSNPENYVLYFVCFDDDDSIVR